MLGELRKNKDLLSEAVGLLKKIKDKATALGITEYECRVTTLLSWFVVELRATQGRIVEVRRAVDRSLTIWLCGTGEAGLGGLFNAAAPVGVA
jgi:hypothetical protein